MEELEGCFVGEEDDRVGWKNACMELSLCEFAMVSPSNLSRVPVLSDCGVPVMNRWSKV